MKHKRLLFGLGLALMFVGQTLHAQQSGADSKKLTELRAKAEKGDAKAENELPRQRQKANSCYEGRQQFFADF